MSPLTEGMTFNDKQAMESAIYSENGLYNLRLRNRTDSRTGASRLTVECRNDSCDYGLGAVTVSGVWTICRAYGSHTCAPNSDARGTYGLKDHLAAVLTPLVTLDTTPAEAHTFVKREGLQTSISTVTRSLEAVRDQLFGNPEDAYRALPEYFADLKLQNPDTQTHIETTADDYRCFMRCFFAFGACVRAFSHTRQFIALDGCHLKSKYGGTLLASVVLDSCGQWLPLCFSVISGNEDQANWAYHVDHMVQCLGGELRGSVVISDKQKGLREVLGQLNGIELRVCGNHLEANVKDLRNRHFVEVFKSLQLCQDPVRFSVMYDQCAADHPTLHALLERTPKSEWAVSQYTDCYWGQTTSNVAESLNAWMAAERRMTVIRLIDSLRRRVGKLMTSRRARLTDLRNSAPVPPIRDIINVNMRHGLAGWNVTEVGVVGGVTRYEVDSPLAQYSVEVGDQVVACSCRFPGLWGCPCEHVCAALRVKHEDPNSFVIASLTVGSHALCYAGQILPPSNTTLTYPLSDDIQAPNTVRPIGRRRIRYYNFHLTNF